MPDFEQPWWSEWSDKIIARYNLKKTTSTGGGEWHGSCPSCGGTDRFWIKEYQGLVKAHCRQGCTISEMADEMRHDGVWPVLRPADNVLHMPLKEVVNNQDDFGDTPKLYHERKGVDLLGARLDGDTVVVPLFNAQRERVGEQRISPDGQKRFSKGLAKDGAFGVCGKLGSGKVFVAEGWATAASCAMAMQGNAVFALDAGNLPRVCEALSEAFPQVELVVAADNDAPGIKAAKASGQRWAAPAQKDADWNDVWLTLGATAVKHGLQGAKREAGLFTHLDDLKITKPEWLIDGLIEQNTLAMCFGAAGSGKTFAVLDMALSVSTGKAYHGHSVDAGTVFYLCGEGHSGFARRSAAWTRTHDVKPGEAKFYKSNRAVIMSEAESVELLKSEMALLVEQAGAPKLVVIDTLARSLGGADENAGKDVNLFIVACDEIKEEYGCTVMLVHHTGHQNKDRGRGASQINAALDHEFRIEAWGEDKVLMTFTKQKEDRMPDPKAFVKLPVELVTDDMEEINSIVLEFTPDLPTGGGSNALTKGQNALVKLFDEMAENGEIERDILRDSYFDRFDNGNRDSTKRKFNRDIRALIEDEVLVQRNGIISRAYDEND